MVWGPYTPYPNTRTPRITGFTFTRGLRILTGVRPSFELSTRPRSCTTPRQPTIFFMFSGFGDAIDNSKCWDPVINFVESRYEEFLDAETRVNRVPLPDTRVHACLYFIAPSGHGLKPLDAEFMRRYFTVWDWDLLHIHISRHFIASLYTLLAGWFPRKNLRRHNSIYNVYYYRHNSSLFDYWQACSLPIWKCTLLAR